MQIFLWPKKKFSPPSNTHTHKYTQLHFPVVRNYDNLGAHLKKTRWQFQPKAVGQVDLDVPEPEIWFAVTDGAEDVGVSDVVWRGRHGNVSENCVWREIDSDVACGAFCDVVCGVVGTFVHEVVPWGFFLNEIVLVQIESVMKLTNGIDLCHKLRWLYCSAVSKTIIPSPSDYWTNKRPHESAR